MNKPFPRRIIVFLAQILLVPLLAGVSGVATVQAGAGL